jgi:hypothetical protein
VVGDAVGGVVGAAGVFEQDARFEARAALLADSGQFEALFAGHGCLFDVSVTAARARAVVLHELTVAVKEDCNWMMRGARWAPVRSDEIVYGKGRRCGLRG